LWRARRWRYLLNLIDHLPRNTYFSQAVASDEEHTRMMLEAQQRAGGEKGEYHPPLAQWSQEAGMLADLIDEVRALRYITTLAAGDGNNRPKPPVPYTRPENAAAKIKEDMRRERHEALVARMLPNRTDGG
jgi:hypothetical protein